MLLRTALREIKKEKAEKFSGVFYRSLVSFIPEESQIEKWDKKELVLLGNQNAIKKEDKESTIKKNFPVSSSGPVEDYLKWTNDMWYIIKNKPCTSPAPKFDTVKWLLAEEALEGWDTEEATVIQKLVLVKSGPYTL